MNRSMSDFNPFLFHPDTRSAAAARDTATPRRVGFLRRPGLATKAAHDCSDWLVDQPLRHKLVSMLCLGGGVWDGLLST
jgi:hypothetical protein